MDETPHIDPELPARAPDADAATDASTSEAAAASFFTRLGWLFFSPGKLGDAIRERPTALVPALVGLALTLASTLLIPQEIMMEAFRARALESGQEVEAFSESAMGIIRLASTGGLLVFWWAILAVSAGIYAVIFTFILGDEARYRQFFSTVAWASIVAGIGALCLTPLRIAARSPQLTLSPGTFLGTVLDEGFLLRAASGLDFFAMWSWVVTGIVISRLDSRRSAGSAVTIVFVIGATFISVFAALNLGG